MKRFDFFLLTAVAPALALFKSGKAEPINPNDGVAQNQAAGSPLRLRLTGRNQFDEVVEEWIYLPLDGGTIVRTQNKFKEILPDPETGELFRIEADKSFVGEINIPIVLNRA